MLYKRILGFVAFVLAIIGGLYAMYNLFFSTQEVQTQVNSQGAASFSASFITSYLSYEKGRGFDSIQAFTKLEDRRSAQESLVQKEVISADPLRVTQLQGNYMHVELLLQVKSKVVRGIESQTKEVEDRKLFLASVYVLQDENGFRVIHYPSLKPYTKPADGTPPFPEKAKSDIVERLQPTLDSFFRTYFVAKQEEELTSYFASGGKIPKPLNGTFDYVNVERVEVYGGSPWLVYATVTVKDPSSDSQFHMSYELSVTSENSKFAIIEMN